MDMMTIKTGLVLDYFAKGCEKSSCLVNIPLPNNEVVNQIFPYLL